jgi:choice-of-anchor B domain-containing protein
VPASFTNAHTITANTQTCFLYVNGGSRASGGLHVLSLNQNPLAPIVAGNFSSDGYSHDSQVISYAGPDPDYTGREIAPALNEDTLTFVDVTNKANMVQVSRSGYPSAGYVHQGWATEDH